MVNLNILNRIKRINNHGFGFVSTKHHFKTMNYQKFLDHLSMVQTDEECIIHMRYATHGSISRHNCHPFEENGVYFAHNGILPIDSVNDMTDSEIVFRDVVYPAIAAFGFRSEAAEKAIKTIIGFSRFAIMYNGQVALYGSYQKLNGIYYSNLRWL